ncbi:hypothetical protein [Klebsiella pneumoniae]|uniref:hypothetical protein n=1 Tax=Klebsiella pneumoniae TaxID=573 RepID=UPI001D0F1032|nr:hypothetical protein [Klebsiella pneumoniae]
MPASEWSPVQNRPHGVSGNSDWSHANNIEYTEALVFYWDDPAETAEDEQRADVALTLNTGSNYSLNIPNLREEYIPGGCMQSGVLL